MKSGVRVGGWSIVASALLLLAAPLSLASPASAHELAGASTTQQWAYGAHANGSAAWTNVTDGYTAALTAYFGWDTVITQTNTSATVVQLEASRTMALDLYVTYCKPACNAAAVKANASFQAWETESGFANLTTNGTVYSGGVPRPALAILNASDQVEANLTESLDGAVHVLLSTKLVSYYLTVQAEAHASAEFSPALGVVPDGVTAGSSWNSSSEYMASGGWAVQFMYAKAPLTEPASHGSRSASGNLAGSGIVSLFGADLGPLTLSSGDVTDAISLLIAGPFVLREGFLLIPSDTDVFGPGDQAWSPYVNSTTTVTTGALDFGTHLGHVGLLASSTGYAPHASQVSTLGPIVPAAAPVPADGNGSSVLQAQPEAIDVAQQNSHCLTQGNCPGQLNPVGPAVRGPLGAGVLLLVIIVVGSLLVGGVIAGRRRTVNAPPNPNRGLYPPPAAPPPPPAPPPGALGRPRPPQSADDPLGHLW